MLYRFTAQAWKRMVLMLSRWYRLHYRRWDLKLFQSNSKNVQYFLHISTHSVSGFREAELLPDREFLVKQSNAIARKLGDTSLPKTQGEETFPSTSRLHWSFRSENTAVELTFFPLCKVNAMGLKEARARTLLVIHCTQSLEGFSLLAK